MLFLDGLRAGFGMLITFGPVFFLAVGWPLAMVLGVVGFIFLWFGLRTLAQCVVSIVPSADGIRSRGLRQRFLAWEDLQRLKLSYYAPIRRRHTGWFQLTLKGTNGSIRLDSTLNGFDDLLQAALAAASRADLAFDPSTRENLAAWAHRQNVSDKR